MPGMWLDPTRQRKRLEELTIRIWPGVPARTRDHGFDRVTQDLQGYRVNNPMTIAPSKTTKTKATNPYLPDDFRATSASPTRRATNAAAKSASETAGSNTKYATDSDSQAPTTVPERSTAAVKIARPNCLATQTSYAIRLT